MSKYKEGDSVWYNGNAYPGLQGYTLTIDSVSSFADWTGSVHYTYEINFAGKSYTVGENYLSDTYQPASNFTAPTSATYSVNGGPSQTVSAGDTLDIGDLWKEAVFSLPESLQVDLSKLKNTECSHEFIEYFGMHSFKQYDYCKKCDVKK